jgi:hypothetical protein
MTATDPLDVGALRQLLALRKAYPNDAGTLDDVMVAAYNSLPALLDALAAARAEIERLKAERTEIEHESQVRVRRLLAERDALREGILAEVIAPIEAVLTLHALGHECISGDRMTSWYDADEPCSTTRALSTAKEATT